MKKYSLIIFIMIGICIGFSSIVSSDQNVVLTIQKGEKIKENKVTYWIIPTTLTNNTKDTLNYFSMSCSWQDFYSINSRKLQIEPSECFKNIPVILTLALGKKEKVNIKLQISQTMDAPKINFKIGFNLIKVKSGQSFFDFDLNEEGKKKQMIWSNEISM